MVLRRCGSFAQQVVSAVIRAGVSYVLGGEGGIRAMPMGSSIVYEYVAEGVGTVRQGVDYGCRKGLHLVTGPYLYTRAP